MTSVIPDLRPSKQPPPEFQLMVTVDAEDGDIVIQRKDRTVKFSLAKFDELFGLADRVRHLEEYFRDGWRNNNGQTEALFKLAERIGGVEQSIRVIDEALELAEMRR
jgi:hypothetical protein